MDFMTKRDYAYQKLREDIVSGIIPSGAKLVINDLAEKYNLSAMPIRSAVARLEEVGLVTSTPHIGAFVASINLNDYFSLMLLRIEMEAAAAILTTLNPTEETIALLEQTMEYMNSTAEAQNLEEYGVANRRFHNIVYNACNNQIVLQFVENLMTRTKIALHSFSAVPTTMSDSLEEHNRWLQAIKARDVLLSASIIRYHRCRANLAMLDHLKQTLTKPDSNDIFYQAFMNDVNAEALDGFIEIFSIIQEQNSGWKTTKA